LNRLRGMAPTRTKVPGPKPSVKAEKRVHEVRDRIVKGLKTTNTSTATILSKPEIPTVAS
jgi:hypothetical protein